jgi:hypothetical protein
MPSWNDLRAIATQDWTCGYCHREVASDRGWSGVDTRHSPQVGAYSVHYFIAICPRCSGPTFLVPDDELQIPGVRGGESVEFLPEDVGKLYDEARDCTAAGAPTAAVLLARKILMHVAVEKGADEGETFKYYVEYLGKNGIVTADMKEWIDEIREFGNDANHELVQMTPAQSAELMTFVSMLVKVVYEYPEKGRRSVAARSGTT